ncbi:MAG TPA: hypothetical protein VMB48_05865 [Steroidobacteraceae bacterium]|nr:hypothetical protein [Steroidobacteraceae bacterium]
MNKLTRVAATVMAGHAMVCGARAPAAPDVQQQVTRAAPDVQLQVARIESSLQQGGPAALQRYFGCGAGSGYDLVAGGNPQAVALAISLFKYSDGCFSESLHSALASALLANPEVVLPYFNTGQLGAGDCIPFISAEAPKGTDESVIRRTEAALRSVTRPELQAAKATCLEQVAEHRRAVAAAQQFCARLDAACAARRSEPGSTDAECTLCPDSPLPSSQP